jgi:thiol-disulfide isomerase/thioredoxin
MVRISFLAKNRKTGAVAAALAAGVAIMAILGADSSTYANQVAKSGPPLTGGMEKFDAAENPVQMPETVFTDKSGRELTLKNFRGKIVLLNFWATWCGPCVREMPSLERLHTMLQGNDFTVIALSEDRRGWDKITRFQDKVGLKGLPLFHDVSSKMMFATKARGLPTTILVGRDGKELGRLTGSAGWDTDEAVALIRYYIGRKTGG